MISPDELIDDAIDEFEKEFFLESLRDFRCFVEGYDESSATLNSQVTTPYMYGLHTME